MIYLLYIVIILATLFCLFLFYLAIRPISSISDRELPFIKNILDNIDIVQYTADPK